MRVCRPSGPADDADAAAAERVCSGQSRQGVLEHARDSRRPRGDWETARHCGFVVSCASSIWGRQVVQVYNLQGERWISLHPNRLRQPCPIHLSQNTRAVRGSTRFQCQRGKLLVQCWAEVLAEVLLIV